jgi:hypothetical protein
MAFNSETFNIGTSFDFSKDRRSLISSEIEGAKGLFFIVSMKKISFENEGTQLPITPPHKHKTKVRVVSLHILDQSDLPNSSKVTIHGWFQLG